MKTFNDLYKEVKRVQDIIDALEIYSEDFPNNSADLVKWEISDWKMVREHIKKEIYQKSIKEGI